MEFYLARHGEAVAELIDPERPLTQAGRESVQRVACLAAEKGVRITVIYHSGIRRASQTADIFARYLTPANGVQTMPGLHPEDDPALAAAELAVARNPLMLVGHLPHLSRLASLLSSGDPDKKAMDFAPAMIACYGRAGALWTLNWTIVP